MSDKDSSPSFLYNLYLKHTKAQSANEREVLKEDSPVSDEPAAAPTVTDAADTADTIAAADDLPQPEQNSPIPSEMAFLEPLYNRYLYWRGFEQEDGEAPAFSEFETHLFSSVKNSFTYTACQDVIMELVREAALAAIPEPIADDVSLEELLTELANSSAQEAVSPDTDSSEPVVPPESPIPAAIHIRTAPNHMYAFLIVLPPLHGGAELTEKSLVDFLNAEEITFGIDNAAKERLCSGASYLQVCLIAQGTFPVNGIDGEITDRINLETTPNIQPDESGNIDFKNLNQIHTVKKDDVLCRISLPTPGVPGQTVSGQLLSASDGKPAQVPLGSHTVLSEEGTVLLADIDGCVTFKNRCYQVDPTLTIKSDINYGVGNIDYPGSVVIYGDVMTGFSVKATGDITIFGMVEGAALTSGGDVKINKGMNGNFTGTVLAEGSITATFMENCTVRAKGSIHTSCLVSCNVSCCDTVYVESGKGVIIGSNITALKSVQARIVGSKSRRETVVTLGHLPEDLDNRAELEQELKAAKNTLESLSKNLSFLNAKKAFLPPEKLVLLEQLNQQQILYREKKESLEQSLAEQNAAVANYNDCCLKCNLLFPPVKITIGAYTSCIDDMASRCTIKLKDDDIQIYTS